MAKSKMNGTMVALIMVVLVALAGIGYLVTQTGFGTDGSTSAEECGIDTLLYVDAVDALNAGTAVATPTITAKIDNGASASFTSGDTKLSPGSNVQLLVSKDNYLDVIESTTVKCGINRVTVEMYATDAGSFRIFNTNNELVTDDAAGGATNQSALSASGSLEVKLDSKQDQSLGDLIVVIEASNTTQVDSIDLSGAADADVPEFYSVSSAGAITDAFRIVAPAGGWDGQSKTYTLIISPESGETIDGTSVYVTAYSEQAFADVDGSYKVGVENSNGVAQYEDDFDFDFMIA